MTFKDNHAPESFDGHGIKQEENGTFTLTDTSALEAIEAREFEQKVTTQTLLVKNLNQYISNPNVSQELQNKLVTAAELHQEILTGEESFEYKKALYLVTKNKLARIYEELGLNIMDAVYTKN